MVKYCKLKTRYAKLSTKIELNQNRIRAAENERRYLVFKQMRTREIMKDFLDGLVGTTIPRSDVRNMMVHARRYKLPLDQVLLDYRIRKRPTFIVLHSFKRCFPKLW